jgi:hypothetical protein
MCLLHQPCTPKEDQRLKDLVEQGASLIRAAAAFNKKTQNVRERARKIGCPFPPSSHRKAMTDTLEGRR